MTLPVDTNLDFQNVNKGINVPNPTSAGDIVNKAYADAIAAGIAYKQSVRGVAITAITLATPGAIGEAVAGDRVLLTAQATASQNGLYIWNGANAALTRTTDFATGSSQEPGTAVFDDNLDGTWVLVADAAVTVDTTSETWTQGASAGNYTFQAPITNTGGQIGLNGGNALPVADGGTGSTTPAAARTALGAIGKYSTIIGNAAATSFTINHNLGVAAVQVQVFDMATGNIELAQVTITSVNALNVVFGAAPAASGGTVPGNGTGKMVVVMG